MYPSKSGKAVVQICVMLCKDMCILTTQNTILTNMSEFTIFAITRIAEEYYLKY